MLNHPAVAARSAANPHPQPVRPTPPELSVLVPTRDEAGNI
jgi:hypothetical protein